jgi:hypothetical protein
MFYSIGPRPPIKFPVPLSNNIDLSKIKFEFLKKIKVCLRRFEFIGDIHFQLLLLIRTGCGLLPLCPKIMTILSIGKIDAFKLAPRHSAQRHSAESAQHYVEIHYADCRYVQCRGA